MYWRSASVPFPNDSADFFHSLWRQQFAAFCLFVRASPIDFALLGRKRKYVKSKTTSKLKCKQTSIAAVRAKLGQIDTFQTPLLSHCRLPLNRRVPLTAYTASSLISGKLSQWPGWLTEPVEPERQPKSS